jgi:N-acetylneuraminic acid mutarotase
MRATAVSLDGRIYMFGGADGISHNETHVYAPLTNTVTAGTALPHSAYQGVAVTAASGHIYVMGGLGGASVTVYNPTDDTFAAAAAMPTALSEFSGALGADGKIYVFAASGPGGINAYDTSHTYIYTPATNTWTQGTGMPSPRNSTQAVALDDGRIAVIAGEGGYVIGLVSNTLEFYTPSTNSWTTGAALPISLFRFVAARRSDGKLVVGGGLSSTGARNTNTYVYDPVADEWELGTPTTSEHYGGYAAQTPDGRVYFMGGQLPGGAHGNVDALY